MLSPMTVSVEKDALELTEERITPVSLKLVEEASRRYPSDVNEEGDTGNAAQFAVMEELKISRKAGATVAAGFAWVEVPPVTTKFGVFTRFRDPTRKKWVVLEASPLSVKVLSKTFRVEEV